MSQASSRVASVPRRDSQLVIKYIFRIFSSVVAVIKPGEVIKVSQFVGLTQNTINLQNMWPLKHKHIDVVFTDNKIRLT